MGQVDLIKALEILAHQYKKKVFSIRDISALLGQSRPAAAMLLLRAQKKGHVFRVKNIWVNLLNGPDLLEVALALISPSYLSMESALFYHQCLSQSPKGRLSLITPGRPSKIDCPLGNIQYFHLQKKLFFGFDAQRIACAEKAFLDLVYLRGLKGRKHILSEEIYFDRLNRKKMIQLAKYFPVWVQAYLESLK